MYNPSVLFPAFHKYEYEYKGELNMTRTVLVEHLLVQ